MAKFYQNYGKLNSFIEQLQDSYKDQFSAIIREGQLVAKTFLQSALDAAGTGACLISTAVVMRRASWLQSSGFPKEFQETVEDLSCEGIKLFTKKTDASLHTQKDSAHWEFTLQPRRGSLALSHSLSLVCCNICLSIHHRGPMNLRGRN